MNRTADRRTAVVACALCLVLGSAGCTTLPSLADRPSSTADFNTGATRLGRAISPRREAHPGVSGVYPLPDGRDAFAARMALAQAADRTLDVHYYIWRNDMTGTMLFAPLRQAADRGGGRVKVIHPARSTACCARSTASSSNN